MGGGGCKTNKAPSMRENSDISLFWEENKRMWEALAIIAAILAGAKLWLFIAASELAEERDIDIELAKARREDGSDEAEADSAKKA